MLVDTALNIAAHEAYGVVGEGVTLLPYSMVLLRHGRERRVTVSAPTPTRAGRGSPKLER